MKDNLQIPDNNRTKYMSVDAKDYQNRKTPLCTPLQINKAVRNQQKSSPKWENAIKSANPKISSEVKSGAIVTGEINGYANCGVFVSLGKQKSGLLHTSKLEGVDLAHVIETSPKGTKIKVKICSIFRDKSGKEKINLDLP